MGSCAARCIASLAPMTWRPCWTTSSLPWTTRGPPLRAAGPSTACACRQTPPCDALVSAHALPASGAERCQMGPCLNVCLPGFSGTDGRYFWLHEILGKLSCVYAIPETHRHEQYCLRNLWGSVHTSIVASQLVPDVPAKRLQKFPGAHARSCRFSGPDRMRASNLTHKVFGVCRCHAGRRGAEAGAAQQPVSDGPASGAATPRAQFCECPPVPDFITLPCTGRGRPG